MPQVVFYEVINEPNPWIAELLAENRNTDVFPPFGQPIMDEQGWHGRFFAPEAPPSASGQVIDLIWQGEHPSTPDQIAKEAALVWAKQATFWAKKKRQPRYRHLLMLSDSCVLEVLCEDLPRWHWVSEK